MSNKPIKSPQELRQRAEEKARINEEPASKATTPKETAQLLHELEVHQIELEMQNEELRRSHEELEASKSRYFEVTTVR